MEAIHRILAGINDPEMPISIVDLGIVDGVEMVNGRVTVRILPTFVGCPALDMLRQEIVDKVSAAAGVAAVDVQFVFDPPWTPARISSAGREHLRRFGVTTPQSGSHPEPLVQIGVATRVACPYCGADDTRRESPFGPTRCRMIYYCTACGNQFEHMKDVAAAARAPSASADDSLTT